MTNVSHTSAFRTVVCAVAATFAASVFLAAAILPGKAIAAPTANHTKTC